MFGTPTRFGAVTAELKAYIDGLGGLWFQGKLNGKAGSAFTSTSSLHGGNESTILSLYNPMAHLGLIIVPLGYADPALFKAGTPYGASAVVNGRDITAAERGRAWRSPASRAGASLRSLARSRSSSPTAKRIPAL